MVDGRLVMATQGTARIHSQTPSSEIKRSGEGVSTCPHKERHLAYWEALHDSLPDLIGVLQFSNSKDLTLNS